MVNATKAASMLDDMRIKNLVENSYRNGFVDGYAEALDIEKVPSDKTLYRIIDLLNEANKEVALHEVDGLTFDEERTLKVEYVKKHLSEE